MKKILITGASGLVGENCLNLLRTQNDFSVLGTHLSYSTPDTIYFNTIDLKEVKNSEVLEFAADYIIHCGALTHVDNCEKHPDESYAHNVQAVLNILELCRQWNSKLIFMSSSYVFDGELEDRSYTESDEVNPISIYGKHKLMSENLIKESGIDYLILRFINAYGSEIRNKNFINRLIINLQSGQKGELTLACDQFGTPVNANDIASAALNLIRDNKSGVYHIAGAELLNRCQLAELIFSYLPENNLKIIKATSEETKQSARRPLNGAVDNSKYLSEYPDFKFSTVRDYLSSYLTNEKHNS